MKRLPVQSVQRALAILDFLVGASLEEGAAPLKSIAAHLGVGDTTAHNILKTLVGCGYAAQTSDRRYTLGPKCHDLTRSAAIGRLREKAAAVALSLAERTGESVSVCTLVDGRRYALFDASGHRLITVNPRFAGRTSFFDYLTARVLAAYASEDELTLILERNELPKGAWEGVGTIEELKAALCKLRRRGYADKRTDDLAAVAAPVLDSDGRILASIGVYLPASRATKKHMADIREKLLEAARQLGEAL